jgi:hypothetical protein
MSILRLGRAVRYIYLALNMSQVVDMALEGTSALLVATVRWDRAHLLLSNSGDITGLIPYYAVGSI